MTSINLGKCMSVKNKFSCEQCPNNKKHGHDYCGIHLRSKKIIRIDQIKNIDTLSDNIENVNITKHNKKVINSIISYDELQELKRNNNNDFITDKVSYTIEYFNLSKNSEKYSVIYLNNLYEWIKNLETKYLRNVIKVQSYIKRWLCFRKTKSNNQEDFGTMEHIFTLPIELYFQYKDSDNFIYSFDLRSLQKLMENKNPINPYNMKELPINDKFFVNRYNSKINILNKSNKFQFKENELTPDQKYKHLLTDVFQSYDMLGNYTNISWFEDLNIDLLKKLYKGAEDMFNYRANLSNTIKCKIVKNGKAFNKLLNELNYLQEKHKRFIQIEILNEFKRFATESQDEEYAKLGTNLMLSALVEVSFEAAEALPHLVQSTF